MARLRISLLGGFGVTLDGNRLTTFESDKVRALLAYLACNADLPQRREALATLLWPEQPPRQSRHNLRQALFNLRSTINDQASEGPFLDITTRTIHMDHSGDTWIDVSAFLGGIVKCQEQHHKVAPLCDECLEGLENSTALYHGRFLEGFSLDGCQEFNHWVLSQAEHLQRQALDIQMRLVTSYQARAEAALMLQHALRWTVLDAYSDTARRAAMVAYILNGQRGEAIQQYEAFRQLMKSELGIEPQAETRELYMQLLKDELPEGMVPLRILPDFDEQITAECPYRGLASFREIDSSFFFGREAFTELVYQRMTTGSMLASVVGPSGSGKSSLVFAGLIPRLRLEGDWAILEMRPGSDPLQALTSTFSQGLGLGLDRASIYQNILEGETTLWDRLLPILEEENIPRRILLVLDQFEELYTLCADKDVQQRFLDEVLGMVARAERSSAINFVALLTLRADFMSQALSYRPLADILQDTTLLMGPMNRAELHAAIERPAQLHGARFESGLVSRLLDDVGEEPGNLPLLEFALTLLWEQMDSGWLSHTAYESIGRVDGALAGYAESVYNLLDEREKDNARKIFMQLVRPGEGTEDTRRIAAIEELGEEKWPLVRHLADRRLVVTGGDLVGKETVEVAHEALIQKWDRFQAWMRADRAFRAWQERLRVNIHQWQRSNHDEGTLLRGAPLAEAEGWMADQDYELSLVETEYIHTSIKQREQEWARRDRRRKLVMAGLLVGLSITVVLLLLIWQQRQGARLQASIGLASQAMAELTGESPERAVLLALEALEHYPYTWQAERALGQAILDGRLRGILSHDDFVNSAQWSADNTRILTSSSDGSIRLWDANSGEELSRISEAGPVIASWSPDESAILIYDLQNVLLKVWDMQSGSERFSLDRQDLGSQLNINFGNWAPWSPNGERFLTYDLNGVVKIRDAKRGNILASLIINPDLGDYSSEALPEDLEKWFHGDYAENNDQALWSPDGELIATSSNLSNSVSIWHADSGMRLYLIPGEFEDQSVYAGNWSPAGDRFTTRGVGGVKIYNRDTGNLELDLPVPGVSVVRTIWSPDGRRVLTSGNEDGIARIWETDTGKELFQITTIQGAMGSDWSIWDDRVAIGGNDGIVHIWDASNAEQQQMLYGTQPRISTVAFSPSGKRLLSVGDENNVHIYDLSESELDISFSTGPMAWISNVDWSPDGSQLLVGLADKTIRVWDKASGKEQLVLSGHDGAIWSNSWSPAGDRIVSCGDDRTVRIWDAVTGEQELIFTGHKDFVLGSFWSPDGSQVASSDISSGEVIVWDAHNGEVITTFSGHQNMVSQASWSPDGKFILSTGAFGEALVWESATGQLIHNLFPDDFQLDVLTGAWTSDGQQVFVQTTDGVVRKFDANSGSEIDQFEMPRASLSYIALSPNEERMLKGGMGVVQVWDLGRGVELLSYDSPGWSDAVYSPDGMFILVGSNHGSLKIFPTWNSAEELIEYAKECCVLRALTPEEREMFGLPLLVD